MKYSDIALKVLAARECGIIKTASQFWKKFYTKEAFEKAILNDERLHSQINTVSEKIIDEIVSAQKEGGIICAYDADFPVINRMVRNDSEKPFLLFYKGDLSLLNDLNRNVAVVGLVDPAAQIIEREKKVVKMLVEDGNVIVSGLALGCDTVAHKVCLEAGGKTIAILPSTLYKIYPAANYKLAEDIVAGGGLLISEYYREPATKHEAIKRFVERDRLQAMFAKAIILIASYRKGEGDSGSRHAMEAAIRYGIDRYVMYDGNIDENDSMFGLNKDLLNANKAKVLTPKEIHFIKTIKKSDLTRENWKTFGDQITLW
ncbi:DNA processing protein [Thermosyntropha lipolytica DSM 11003]|uniref:DNA processing protein n=1 Tax=Thermosyntropha lipolytica DSM 11003 TaxID=1123382 RepID=A0A1M5K1P2_9FIRM|nr:DNA-processing protein DprA [Thermosyntropha lipolytica]SHG46635.1 DNA processing protein [Thermosyntropha lipolytica DSM 11003]